MQVPIETYTSPRRGARDYVRCLKKSYKPNLTECRLCPYFTKYLSRREIECAWESDKDEGKDMEKNK